MRGRIVSSVIMVALIGGCGNPVDRGIDRAVDRAAEHAKEPAERADLERQRQLHREEMEQRRREQ